MTASPCCAVRTARFEDLEAVIDVHAGDSADRRRPVATSERQREMWRRMMNTRDLTVYVAVVGDALVGTATAMVMPNITYGCAPTMFVEAVVVVPRYRRQGVATAMIQRVLADARATGCNKVQLLSHKRHATDGAHHLYAGLGFEPEAEGFRLYLRGAPTVVSAARSP